MSVARGGRRDRSPARSPTNTGVIGNVRHLGLSEFFRGSLAIRNYHPAIYLLHQIPQLGVLVRRAAESIATLRLGDAVETPPATETNRCFRL